MIRENRKMLSGIEIFKFFVSNHLNRGGHTGNLLIAAIFKFTVPDFVD